MDPFKTTVPRLVADLVTGPVAVAWGTEPQRTLLPRAWQFLKRVRWPLIVHIRLVYLVLRK
jgi:hypothetical protein